MSHIAPRALLRGRQTIPVEMSPWELHQFIRMLEDHALQAAENPRCHLCEFAADALLLRVAQLREASR